MPPARSLPWHRRRPTAPPLGWHRALAPLGWHRALALALGWTRRRASPSLLLLALTSTLLVTLVLPLSPAVGHPGGGMSPPHARLSADGNVVTVEWSAPPDDAAYIGEAVDIFPPGTMEAFLTGPDEALPTDEEVRELSTSAELEAYFLEHVQVHQDGTRCPGEAEVAADFLEDGAEVHFACPDRIAEVDVRVTVLHDQDPRYDTFGVDGTVWAVLFTAAQPEHRWDATAAATGSGTIPLSLVVAAVLLVAALVAWWLFARRLRQVRRRGPTPGPAGVHRQAGGVRRRRRATSTSVRRV